VKGTKSPTESGNGSGKKKIGRKRFVGKRSRWGPRRGPGLKGRRVEKAGSGGKKVFVKQWRRRVFGKKKIGKNSTRFRAGGGGRGLEKKVGPGVASFAMKEQQTREGGASPSSVPGVE